MNYICKATRAYMVVCAVAVAAVCTPLAASSQANQPIQELFLADLPYPQARGETQLMLGQLLERRSRFPKLRTSLGAELGLTDLWQVEAGVSILRDGGPIHATQWQAASFGIRRSWSRLQHNTVQVALGMQLELPLHDDEEGASIAPSLSVVKALPWPRGMRAVASAEYTIGISGRRTNADVGDAGEPRAAAELHVAAILPAGRVRLTTELSRLPEGILGSAGHYFLTPGIVVPLKGDFELGFAVFQGLSRAHSQLVGIKATYEF